MTAVSRCGERERAAAIAVLHVVYLRLQHLIENEDPVRRMNDRHRADHGVPVDLLAGDAVVVRSDLGPGLRERIAGCGSLMCLKPMKFRASPELDTAEMITIFNVSSICGSNPRGLIPVPLATFVFCRMRMA